LKDGHIDTVIGLPANLFFSTGIPVCILVLKKCKKFDDVLFVNASEHYEKGKRQNRLRDGEDDEPNDIKKIIETYQYRPEKIERYARRVSMGEIEKNDFNLNISRYVNISQEEETIDLKKVNDQLADIEKKVKEARAKHNKFLKELGLPSI
jgi:type I restriction enzyme M protein